MTTLAADQKKATVRRRRTRSNDGLDSMGQRLIALLQREGRMPNTALAERLKVSEGTIRRRMSQLLESRAMTVVAVPDWKAFGYEVEALVGLQVDLHQLDAVANKLSAMQQIQSVMTVTGPFDIFCKIVARSTADLARFLETEVASISGVRTAQTFMALTVTKREYETQAA
ncbi:MAG: Lrp/AsnC family transcriptional regulator [Dehalococcoidia bacterium]